MRILYLHQHFTTRLGVGGTRSYEFAKYLRKKGHEVSLICGDYAIGDVPITKKGIVSSLSEIDGINVVRINVRYSSHMPFLRRVVSFLLFLLGASWVIVRTPKPDVIFATSTPVTIACPALLGFYLRRIPFVFEVRDLWPEVPIEMGILRNSLLKKMTQGLAKLAYTKASKVISLSPGISEGIMAHGIAREKISHIPNASDIDLFNPNQAFPEIAQSLGIREDQFVVGYFGAMGKANGLDVMIDAAEILDRRNPGSYIFLVVGDGPERIHFQKIVSEKQISNVMFVDQVPRAEVPKYFAVTDACLIIFAKYKSLEANSPNKLFDALAAGKPVVINKAGWMKCLVEENNIGLAIPDCTAGDLAQGLQALSASSSPLVEMAKRARTLAEKKFERLMLAEKLDVVLRDSNTGILTD